MQVYLRGEQKELRNERIEQLYLNRSNTAVITIDMTATHLSQREDCPCPAERGREIIAPLNAFTESCRSLGLPVIHVRSVLRADGADDVNGFISAWRLLFPESGGSLPYCGDHAFEGTRWTDFAVKVEPDDYVINGKKRLSAFYPTDLELLLRNLGVKSVVLTGVNTDCCILNTCFDAANRDFRVVVARDLTRGEEAFEESALQIISTHLGLVADSQALLQHWRAQA